MAVLLVSGSRSSRAFDASLRSAPAAPSPSAARHRKADAIPEVREKEAGSRARPRFEQFERLS
jgi:hypothetical protein